MKRSNPPLFTANLKEQLAKAAQVALYDGRISMARFYLDILCGPLHSTEKEANDQ